jgi:hypothetical protein
MERAPARPGPLESEKRADDAEEPAGEVQPQAAEVESARLLANQARAELSGTGLSEEDIRRLADEFVARDRGDEEETFVEWARHRCAEHSGEAPPP